MAVAACAADFTLAVSYGNDAGLTKPPLWVDLIATTAFSVGLAALLFGIVELGAAVWRNTFERHDDCEGML
ncbi:MAG: hypothetical protein P4L93_06465 [Coriobacteriia bacterium]|nr:hypothetical protein [Coriobacteriia bacterium]